MDDDTQKALADIGARQDSQAKQATDLQAQLAGFGAKQDAAGKQAADLQAQFDGLGKEVRDRLSALEKTASSASKKGGPSLEEHPLMKKLAVLLERYHANDPAIQAVE